MNAVRNEEEKYVLKKFGDNLKRIRESNSLTQEQLAYDTGLSRSYYAEVENGIRNLSLLNIVKIAGFLKIELNELISINDLPKSKV